MANNTLPKKSLQCSMTGEEERMEGRGKGGFEGLKKVGQNSCNLARTKIVGLKCSGARWEEGEP